MEEQLRLESSEQIRIRRKRLERNENRIAELKRLFIRIYEDNACGRLSDERFDMLSLTYETEQKQLETECVTLRQEIEVQERQNENVEKFIQTAHKYVGIDKLDGYALRELVSAIYVDAPDKSSGKRVQHIHIQYDGLGLGVRGEREGRGAPAAPPRAPFENSRFSPFFHFTVLRPPGQ